MFHVKGKQGVNKIRAVEEISLKISSGQLKDYSTEEALLKRKRSMNKY